MPIGMLGIYRLRFVCFCLFVCLQHRNRNGEFNGLGVGCPAARYYTSFQPARNTWAVTAIGMWGYAPVRITNAFVTVSVIVSLCSECMCFHLFARTHLLEKEETRRT